MKDIYEGHMGSLPKYLTVFNDKLYFSADDKIHGKELWVYDGTNDPSMVKDIYEGSLGSDPSYLRAFNEKLYFCASDLGNGNELWIFDGINEPTMLNEIYYGYNDSNPMYFNIFKNRLYFIATDRNNGYELWVYDPAINPTDIEEVLSIYNSGKSFKVYPNPTHIELNIDLGQTYHDIVLTDKNITGNITTIKSFRTTSKIIYKITGPKGLYFIEINSKEGNPSLIKIMKN